MSMPIHRPLAAALLPLGLAAAATAEVPSVATDIAPVHGLVARVMDGLGEPEMIVRTGASPHAYSLRPSEARTLDQADAVFWIGPELLPWLEETIGTLASDASIVALIDAPGTTTLEFREGATFEAHDHAGHDHNHEGHDHAEEGHDHDHEDHDHADEGHDHDHEDHDHADEGHNHDHEDHAERDHDHGEEGHDHAGDHAGHDHSGTDPHAWLDPENGKVWLGVIADELAALDPDNAEAYRANAEAGTAEIDAAVEEARATLEGAGPLSFVVFHDAYHYFENRFGIAAAGAISLSDASDPTPARVEEVRDTVRDLGVDCVFSEPQFDQRLVRTVLDGTDGQAGVIDPLGFDIPTGPGFYPALIRDIAEDMASCS